MLMRILGIGLIGLTLTACGLRTPTTTTTLPVQTIDQALADPSSKLSGAEIKRLVDGKTAYSFSYGNSGRTQVGYFKPNKDLKIRTDDFIFEGTWAIDGDKLCYSLADTRLCSYIHKQTQGADGTRYFSVRANTGASGDVAAVFTKFTAGNVSKL